MPPDENDFFSSSDDEDEEMSDPSAPTSNVISTKKVALRSSSSDVPVAIPMLDFGKLNLLSPRTGGSAGALLSPHPSPPRSPSSPTISKPDCAKYRSIEGSPRSAFVKPNSA